MKRLIPVLVPIILILIIGGIMAGRMLVEKYSYSKEEADLDAYFGVEPGSSRLAIILQDEMVEEQAYYRDGICYFDLAAVHRYFNDGFYVDEQEGLLLYTTATETARVRLGEASVDIGGTTEALSYVPAMLEGDRLYIAADYLRLYTNFSWNVYDRHVQVYTEWGTRQVAMVRVNTAVRVLGGIKSPILRAVEENEQVEILETMETWSKVKTSDSIIGYIENKQLTESVSEEEMPVTDYVEAEYTTRQLENKLCLGWHAIGGVAGNDTLSEVTAEAKGLNVIAPTWFSLSDDEGNFRSFGTVDYVDRAHGMGLQVWGVLDDFNYAADSGAAVDVYKVLSSTTRRTHLVEGITGAALQLGLDGINLDFEKVGADAGEHFAQFVRELSVQCRLIGLTLSIDNYVPFSFNEYMRRDVQGKVADYVIVMGYDEHWGGSGDPGSVASINYVSSGIDKTLNQVPADKVVNALPFYTRLWKINGAAVTDEAILLANTMDFLARMGVEPVWDEETQQYYAEWTRDSITYKIWAETVESIEVKLNVMKVRDIAGVAVWRLGYGNDAVWEMISAYVNS